MSEVRRRWVTKDQVGCEANMGHVTFIMLAGVGGRAWNCCLCVYVCVCFGSVIGEGFDVRVVGR